LPQGQHGCRAVDAASFRVVDFFQQLGRAAAIFQAHFVVGNQPG